MRIDPVGAVIRDVDWKTLVFLAAIFTLIQAFIKTKLLQGLSSLLANIPVVAAALDLAYHDLGVMQGGGDFVQVPDSTAVTACFSESIERMMNFSNSTTRKKPRPPASRIGHTWSGIASLPNTACSGGA